MTEPHKTQIEISTTSIIQVLLVLFLLWFLYVTRDIVLMVFVSLLLVSILQPVVSWARSKGIPPAVSVSVLYLILAAIVGLIFFLLIPPIVDQSSQMVQSISGYWDQVTHLPLIQEFSHRYNLSDAVQQAVSFVQDNLSAAGEGVVSKVTGFFGSVFSFFVILVITFYVLTEDGAMKRILRSIVPSHYHPYLARLFSRIQDKMGRWIRGQLILSLIVFVLLFIGLTALGVRYALVLSIIAGLLEFVPYIGPVISASVAVFLSVFQDPFKAFLILILYVVIQQVENHILVPKVMQKAVGLNPIVSIVALLVGAKLGGAVGIILAIPVVTALSVFVTDVIDGGQFSHQS